MSFDMIAITRRHTPLYSRLAGALLSVFACAMMVNSAFGACQTSVSGSPSPDITVGGGVFTPSKVTVSIIVTTVSGGSPCANPPTLTGGSVHVDLMYNQQIKFSGDANIVAGVGSQTQVVKVVITLSPKPNPAITCQVCHRGVAYFSDGSTRTYTSACGGSSAKKVSALKSLPKKIAYSPSLKNRLAKN